MNNILRPKSPNNLRNYVGMACEEVGIVQNGEHKDMVARVCIVDHERNILIDKYVKPQHPVHDYRTEVSGIHPGDLEKGEDFYLVQNQVKEILKNKALVGFSVGNDLRALNIEHTGQIEELGAFLKSEKIGTLQESKYASIFGLFHLWKPEFRQPPKKFGGL